MKSKRLRAYDRKFLRGRVGLIGVDEAGRGALAGPVVAAAVAVRKAFYDSDWCKRNASRINDSKQLSVADREELYERLRWLEKKERVFIGVGKGTIDEIEELNILGATQLAMRRAVEEILEKSGIAAHDPDPLFEPHMGREKARETLSRWLIMVDGRPMRSLGYKHRAVVNGDALSLCIAMGSIVAKVTRDRYMMALDCEYPQYDLAASKGYATASHRQAIAELGPTSIHRQLFIRNVLQELRPEDNQQEFGFLG